MSQIFKINSKTNNFIDLFTLYNFISISKIALVFKTFKRETLKQSFIGKKKMTGFDKGYCKLK